MTRAVREDQHGTRTGYSYGCRCRECSRAGKEHRKADSEVVTPAVRDAVWAALNYEADMDGLVTSPMQRLAEAAGLSHASVSRAVRMLANDGRLRVIGRLPVRAHSCYEIQLIGGAA